MILGEDLATAEERTKEVGRRSGAVAHEVHTFICDDIDIDPVALENFINHTTENLSRYMPMSNMYKTMAATAMRHCFAVGALAARADEERHAV